MYRASRRRRAISPRSPDPDATEGGGAGTEATPPSHPGSDPASGAPRGRTPAPALPDTLHRARRGKRRSRRVRAPQERCSPRDARTPRPRHHVRPATVHPNTSRWTVEYTLECLDRGTPEETLSSQRRTGRIPWHHPGLRNALSRPLDANTLLRWGMPPQPAHLALDGPLPAPTPPE